MQISPVFYLSNKQNIGVQKTNGTVEFACACVFQLMWLAFIYFIKRVTVAKITNLKTRLQNDK